MMRKFVLVAGLALVLLAPQAAHVDAANSETYQQLNLFGDVFERVRAEYVEEVSDEELIEAAIQGVRGVSGATEQRSIVGSTKR